MVKRLMIHIDEDLCTGCGNCVPGCAEGALQIIDGKARLVSETYCDGLGACVGECPQGAMITVEREAEPYDEKKTMENIVKCGENTIVAHLNHLKDHGETGYLNEALEFLEEKGIKVDLDKKTCDEEGKLPCGCPGSKVMDFSKETPSEVDESGTRISQLRQWPVQLTLVPPNASYFQGKDVVLVADCVGYALGDFHKDYLKDKSIAIACPKLDSNIDMYVQKLTSLIDDAKINTLTVMTMEVPCCSGLISIAKKATENASRKIPIKSIVVSIKGEILKEEWI